MTASQRAAADFAAELTKAENVGRQVAAELLDLAGGALGGWVVSPAPRRPGPTA